MKLWQTYTLGRKTYYRFQREDGTLAPEVGGEKMVEEDARTKVEAMSIDDELAAEYEPIKDFSDDELVAELESRSYTCAKESTEETTMETK